MNAISVSAALLAAALGGIALLAAPISAMPGWSHPSHAGPAISEEQRDQIRNLHSAYRAALSSLDWSVDESVHSSETMQRARELRVALRAEIVDVLQRGDSRQGSAHEGTCPYSGRTTPVSSRSNADTLYL